ncbi:hypothetical protein LM010_12375 [Lacticaseibacillus manihotivorans]|uniref:SDR-like Ig domain-containing protein n=3 Tax=Lacticaseibacillus manihotivorans TaxID=88233 RepID=A0A5P8JSD8_9LACO|nr:Ig-like domain-containing protein [Lacticaseibacillus manihotivorans]QFQ92165.1 hypothetical protein LM010_12375 [Lacticaseibacillus manihotivorans]
MLTHAKFWRWLVTLLAGIMVTQVVVTSMTTAQIAGADGGRDLSTVVAGGSILDHVQATFTDASGKEISADQVTTASKLTLDYDWSIPDNLAQAGDTFNFDLPKNCVLTKRYGGDLVAANGTNFGSWAVTPAGHVTFTFNENVKMSGVKGHFEVSSEHLNFDSLGHQDILVPLVKDQTSIVPITVIPNNRVDIAKAGGKQVGTSDEVDWQLGINNMSLTMKDVVITENLPATLNLAGVEIQTATANPNADKQSVSGWTGTGNFLVEGTDYNVKDNQIHLIGAYANTNSPLLVTVKTKLADPDQPQNEQDVTNQVSLSWEGQEMPDTPPDASNHAHINYVPKKWIEKDFAGSGADAYHYKWKVQYNQNSEALAKNTTLTDTLGAGQTFITDGSGEFTLSTGRYWQGSTSLDPQIPLVKDTDYTVDYSGQQMVITLKKAISEPLILTYDVLVDQPTNGQKLENTVSDDKGHKDSDTGVIDTKPVVNKTVTDSSEADHQITYSIDLNTTNQPLSDLELTDKLTSNNATHTVANLISDTLKLVDQTTNQTLTAGTDFTVTTSDNRFVLTLKHDYAHANCKNKLATPWHDTVRRTVTFDELS